MNDREQELRAAAEKAGQGHLFQFWESLPEERRSKLLDVCAGIDFQLVAQLARDLQSSSAAGDADSSTAQSAPEPPELFPLERDAQAQNSAAKARAVGEQLLRAGRLGYVLVAGGQASRLGYDGPKGNFPVGPVSERTLFEVHARRLLAASRRYGSKSPWYVMTSRANDATTRETFERNAYFGMDKGDVFFFTQDMLPALDQDGKILMADRDLPFMAPNGHGGSLAALRSSGALDDMRERGIEEISYFQVDNPLVRPADELFIGLHSQRGAEMSSKAVEKVDPGEKVGVIGRMQGRMGIIEYSDLAPDLRDSRDASGKLRFRAGNIAVHLLRRDFVESLTKDRLELPWHRAAKVMNVIDEDGQPAQRAGTKFETFVFDALGFCNQSVTLEVDRSLEFSPVKNAEGSDSPATARADLCKLWSGWVQRAGLELPAADENGIVPIEIDPLLAESEEEFVALGALQPKRHPAGHLYE